MGPYNGYSLHIGLNRLDSDAYSGWSGQLFGCENDARSMRAIALALGYDETTLLTQDATSHAVLGYLDDLAGCIDPGDTFLFTNSGHGGQVPGPEADGYDETLCLYDREVLDDEIYARFKKFPRWAKIIWVSDACYSGGMDKELKLDSPKGLPSGLVQPAYHNQKELYDSVDRLAFEKYDLRASVCLLSACQENQTAADGWGNGLFTEKLMQVLSFGFEGDYWQLHKAVTRLMPPEQSPRLIFVGRKRLDFEWSKAFTF